jgi:hypothetical protein
MGTNEVKTFDVYFSDIQFKVLRRIRARDEIEAKKIATERLWGGETEGESLDDGTFTIDDVHLADE